MAKLDELDPRWIVEFRPDHNNPNNWHWVEKDASDWSRKKIKELLKKVVVKNDAVGECHIKEVSEVTGDVTANNRKGKLIFLIDLKIKANWEGLANGEDTTYKGEIEIPEFDDVNIDNFTIDVTVKATTDTGSKLKELMRTKGVEQIHIQLGEYLRLLREEYSRDLILPTAKSQPKLSQPVTTSKSKDTPASFKSDKQPVRLETTTLTLTEGFRCGAAQLYMVLTEEASLKAICSGDAQVDTRPGGRFSLYDGAIEGEFVNLEPFKRIVQKWRLRSWGNDNHFSEVTMDLNEGSSGDTILELKQTGVPSKNVEETKNGWYQNFIDRLKAVHGLGAMVM